MDILETEKELGIRLIPGGSRVTCFPAPADTDRDFIAYVEPKRANRVISRLAKDGWLRHEGSAVVDVESVDDADLLTGRTTFRRDADNLILVWNLPTYEAFIACTDLARRMNLTSKMDRVELFATVRRLWPGTWENQSWKAETEVKQALGL